MRLKEERQRIEPHQGRFAERIGISQKKQSFYETGYRELRADYLALVAAAGIDVCYVLTGERADLGRLSAEASALVTSFERLPGALQQAAIATIDAMAGTSPTLHAPRRDYRGPAVTPAATLPSAPALERMFEALLIASPGMSEAELAHELAQRLPSALAAASGPLLEREADDPDAPPADAGSPANDRHESPRARHT